jgi:RNA recognition motif-containing protein
MTNIYIGNLDFSTTEDQLRALSAAHGVVDTVTIVRRSGYRPALRFHIPGNDECSEAEKAIQTLNGTLLVEDPTRSHGPDRSASSRFHEQCGTEVYTFHSGVSCE